MISTSFLLQDSSNLLEFLIANERFAVLADLVVDLILDNLDVVTMLGLHTTVKYHRLDYKHSWDANEGY
jgi:hypothetical protein